MRLTTEGLNAIESKVKVKVLCETAGLPYTTIKSKMSQNRDLTDEESAKLSEALRPLKLSR